MKIGKRLKELAARRKRNWTPRPQVLTHPNIPAPMHGLAPRVILGNKWWNETRRAAYQSTNYHCLACGVHKSKAKGRKYLDAHEAYLINYAVGRMEYAETIPLCQYCHNYIHSGRLAWLLSERKITQAKYASVIQHGDSVLAGAGLTRKPYSSGPMAPWDSWRLVVFGIEYPPKRTTFDLLDEEYVEWFGSTL